MGEDGAVSSDYQPDAEVVGLCAELIRIDTTNFGNASGPVDALNTGLLAAKGSLYVTRPTLATFSSNRATLEEAAARLFKVVRDGAVKIAVNATYPLAEAQQVHRDLAGRETTGSIVMLP